MPQAMHVNFSDTIVVGNHFLSGMPELTNEVQSTAGATS